MDNSSNDKNKISNDQLYQEGVNLKVKVEQLQNKIDKKISTLKSKQEEMNSYRQQIIDQIDQYFDKIIERVNQRRENLKTEYKQIENKEKRKLKSKQMKAERDLNTLKEYQQELSDFLNEFDTEMDYLANKASFDQYLQELLGLEQDMKNGVTFFQTSEFKYPTFHHLQQNFALIDQIGKITDNSDFSMPLTVFNTHKLQVYCYNEKVRDFVQLKLSDDDNLVQNDVPQYFKSIYIPDDKFLLAGGLEANTSFSSNKSYMIDDKGKLQIISDMIIGRQYFTFVSDYINDIIYAIGGYNHEYGVLKSVEKFHIKARKWIQSDSKINHGRINASGCKCGSNYLYLFGGLDKKDFLDSIERYNIQLNIWTQLKIKLPQKMANLFSFSLNQEHIVILGGLKKKPEEFIPKDSKKGYELENRVFVLKTSSFKWKDIKPFPFKKKFGNIVYNNHGKFFCFVNENNRELPQLFVYDVRNCFPQFDKYWENEQNQKDVLQKIKGKDIKVILASLEQEENQKNKQKLIDNGRGPLILTENDPQEHNQPTDVKLPQPGANIELSEIKK